MRRVATFALTILSAATTTVGVAQTQSVPMRPDRGVLTDNEYFMMMPAELIAAPLVTNVSFSGNHRFALIQRMSMRITSKMLANLNGPMKEPPGETSLILWDSEARQSREVWKSTTPEGSVEQMAWIPQTETALVLVRQRLTPDPKKPQIQESRHALLRVTSTTEKAQVVGLTELGEEGMLNLWTSPVQPIVVLRQTRFIKSDDGSFTSQDILHLVGETGRIIAHVQTPQDQALNSIEPAEDGGPALLFTKFIPDKKAVQSTWYVMNPRTAALTPIAKQPQFKGIPAPIPGASDYPVRIQQTNSVVKEAGSSQPVGLLWLESIKNQDTAEKKDSPAPLKSGNFDSPRALVSADSPGGLLIPHADVVFFHSQGAAWAEPLIRLNREQFLAAREAALRTTVISNAKQLGLAAIMYAQDYDETLPTPDGINGKLEPYLKNDLLFQDFSYTYPGGKLGDIASPAETELGYVTGPGGRAIIYSDGHVKWKKN